MAYPLAGLCQLLGVRRMDDGELQVHGNWTASTGIENRATTYFGNAHYRLRHLDGAWRIAKKKTVILNDMIHEVVDFYHL
jgi:3-phenylpropionate/cinnamic acid dioxygenase small subunit